MERWTELTRVFCLVLDGVGAKDFVSGRDGSAAAAVDAIFPHKLEFVSPLDYGSTVAEELLALPLSKRKEKDLRRQYGTTEKILKSGTAFHAYR